MLVTTARLETDRGSQYLQQLCKHFAHKVEVDHDDRAGRAALPSGDLRLAADPGGLSVRIEAGDAKSLIQARYAVDIHLATFAFREDFAGMAWVLEPA